MKKTLCLIGFLIVSSYNSFSQVVSFEVDSLYAFQHDASLTTHQANVNDEMYLRGIIQVNAKLIFNFDDMIVLYLDSTGERVYPITEKKRYTQDNKTFNASFYAWDIQTYFNVVTSPGIEKEDGIVVYFRYLENEKGKDLVKGCFGTNIILK